MKAACRHMLQLLEASHAAAVRSRIAEVAAAPPRQWAPPRDGDSPVEFVPLNLHGTGLVAKI